MPTAFSLPRLLASLNDWRGPNDERDRALTLSQTPGALAPYLGSGVEPAVRLRTLDYLLWHLPVPVLLAPDLVPLLEQCLDDGIKVKPLLDHMAGHRGAPLRRRVFDRLWPIVESRTLPASWADLTPADVVPPLVRAAPSPDLLAILLDASPERDWAHSLIGAILQRPTPRLVPALERWSATHPTRMDQLRVQAALKACRAARPW